MALRGAYGTGWLPPSVAARIVRVEPHEEGRAVIITLQGGTRIVDRAERIDIVGRTDDVAIHEMVAAIVRRGWDAVELHGSDDFRRAMALRLALLEPPVPVAGFVFSEADQTVLEQVHEARKSVGMAASLRGSQGALTPSPPTTLGAENMSGRLLQYENP